MNKHKEALATARIIATQVKLGNLGYDEGKAKAKPYMDIADEGLKEVAKKHGMRPYKVSWSSLVR